MHVLATLAGVTFLALAGCSRGESRAVPHFVSRDTTHPLAAGDVRIASVDTAIEVGVVGDSVVAGFGKRVLDQIKEKTDTSAVAGSGFGASIEKLVKSSVAGAMSKQIQYPISSIQDVKYENGRLQFYGTNGSRIRIFDDKRDTHRDSSDAFRPADAQRFIDAFHARKSAAK
jgi:hypothetical protein